MRAGTGTRAVAVQICEAQSVAEGSDQRAGFDGDGDGITPESQERNRHRDRCENEHGSQRQRHSLVGNHRIEIGATRSKCAERGSHPGHQRDGDCDQCGNREGAIAVREREASRERGLCVRLDADFHEHLGRFSAYSCGGVYGHA